MQTYRSCCHCSAQRFADFVAERSMVKACLQYQFPLISSASDDAIDLIAPPARVRSPSRHFLRGGRGSQSPPAWCAPFLKRCGFGANPVIYGNNSATDREIPPHWRANTPIPQYGFGLTTAPASAIRQKD